MANKKILELQSKRSKLEICESISTFITSIEVGDPRLSEYLHLVDRLENYEPYISNEDYSQLLFFVQVKLSVMASSLCDMLSVSTIMGAVAEDDSLSSDWHLRELAEAEFILKKNELLKAWYTFVISNSLLD